MAALRRTVLRRNVYDPLFMREVKRAAETYREAFYEHSHTPIGKEAFLDIDEHGPAWHLGHMRSAARVLQEKMNDFDFIVDIRDARLPFSTCNPDLVQMSRDKPRIIVFNKAELANEDVNAKLQQYFEDQGMYSIFTSMRFTWKDTVETIRKFAKFVLPAKQHKLDAYVGCVVGMPNVGKSTFINALRNAHEYQFHREDMRRVREGEMVSVTPGTTRSVRSVPVSRDPNIVLYDSPGITMPGCLHKEAGFKMAACGILPVGEVGSLTAGRVSRFIFDIMHGAGAVEHMAECLHLPRAPVTFDDLRSLIAERSGKAGQSQMGNSVMVNAENIIINDFKAGRLGRITLDRLPKSILRSTTASDRLQIGAGSDSDGAYASHPFERDDEAGPRDDDGKRRHGTVHDIAGSDGFTYTHDVRSYETERSYPAHMEDVMRQIHDAPVRQSRSPAAARQRAAGAPASFDADTGVISRRKGAISKHHGADAESTRISRPTRLRPSVPRDLRRRTTSQRSRQVRHAAAVGS